MGFTCKESEICIIILNYRNVALRMMEMYEFHVCNSHKSLIENNIQTLFAATGHYNCVKKIIVAKYDCLCVLILV